MFTFVGYYPILVFNMVVHINNYFSDNIRYCVTYECLILIMRFLVNFLKHVNVFVFCTATIFQSLYKFIRR